MTLQMRDIFLKRVDRPIDGVIKADDEANLRTELEEYVITAEIALRLEHFLDAYNNYTTANGVWISGFFGSGKSHLLKMLAYLLENYDLSGVPAFELFKDKKELRDNPTLSGSLRKAISIPSRSILFNIDQKADVISKTEIDALLAVFQKVFDEMCGYFGKQAHIAQFERDLDSRGEFDVFKAAYMSISGKPWERGREQALLEKANIAKAYAQTTGAALIDGEDLLGNYRKDHRVSIEDFANTVKAWIDQQKPRFRLNFFVDEVGQYIADNTKLMTNLQTIAESLNTRCKGQAWVIVTAQQDMASVIGDLSAQQQTDFSKIQARFANRIPLNSADVAEVIQRRLLTKTDEATAVLKNIYASEQNNLKTLFDFTDGSIRLKNFGGQDHFVQSYPFPPYQYILFQMAITSLSEHNAFEGKHSSVGERSMLGVFQDVAKRLSDLPVGGVATFDLMFEGIRSVLKSSVQQSIQIAERNLDSPLAISVLKVLFLVKYIKEFKPTVRNIGILLLADFDADLIAQRRGIEEALALLERNTLIQRNGETYVFLTNEEKDIEAEIKALDVDPSEVTKELESLIFDETIRQKKIRHVATSHDYPFSRRLDEHLIGKEYELALNVISPFDERAATPEAVKMSSMMREELAVVMPQDALFAKDLVFYKKTDKFVRQASSGAHQPGRDRIVAEKGEQNAKRRSDLKIRVNKLMANARLFVRGDDVEIASDDPQERVFKAFQVLVDKVYVNLPMLRGIAYQEADIGRALKSAGGLFGADGSGLTEAEQEILNFAQSQDKIGVRVSAKALLSKFEARPFGWPMMAILSVTASLVSRGKLEARSDSALLEGVALEKALLNSNVLPNLLLSPQIEFSASQIKKLKDFYSEFFDTPPGSGEAKALGAEAAQAFGRLQAEINLLLAKTSDYPFLAALSPFSEALKAVTGKPAVWYLTDLPKQQDALLDTKEAVLDPIRNFMSGQQKAIYDDARQFLTAQDQNFSYAGRDEARALRAVLDDPTCFKGSTVLDLKGRLQALKTVLDLRVIAERKAVEADIDACGQKIETLPNIDRLTADQRKTLSDKLEGVRHDLSGVTHIAVLRERANWVRNDLFERLLTEVDRLMPAPEPIVPIAQSPTNTPSTPTRGLSEPLAKPFKPAEPKYVNQSALKVSYSKAYLTEEADVEDYLNSMRKTLLAEIRQGKRIIV